MAYLQEQGILSKPLNPTEVVNYIKANHKLDKKQIGEYISNKANKEVLEAFVKLVYLFRKYAIAPEPPRV